MTVPVIFLDEHEANKVAGMLGEISSLEEQKEGLEKKKEETSNTLDNYVMDLFDKKSDVYEKRRKVYSSLGPLPPPSISDDLKSLVLLPEEKEGSISIVYLDEEESSKIAGLMGKVRSLGEQAGDVSQRASIKDRELQEYVKEIAFKKSKLYQDYYKKIDSGHSPRRDIRPILTDDGKAIVIRDFVSTSPRPMF